MKKKEQKPAETVYKKSVSIKDIAKLANVSPATVSRIFHHDHLVKEKTKTKILKVIKQFDYQPNPLARSFRLQETNTVGLIINNCYTSLISNVIAGTEKILYDVNYDFLLSVSNDNIEKEKRCIYTLINKKVAGLIIYPVAHLGTDLRHIYELIESKIPFVFVDRYISTIETNFVGIDNIQSAYEGTKYLVELGHKKIAYIVFEKRTLELTSVKERIAGYKKALMEHNLFDESLIISIDPPYREFVELIDFINNKKPSALFAVNDAVAIQILYALKKKNVKIPDDISVLGFDNLGETRYTTPPLTTVSQPSKLISEESTKLLLNIIDGKEKDIKKIILPTSIMVRESCNKM